MNLPLNERSQALLKLLLAIPPDFAVAETLLEQKHLLPEDVTKVGLHYAEECFLEIADSFGTNWDDRMGFSGVILGLHSTYLYDVVKFLLNFGLLPNGIFSVGSDQYNIMESLKDIDNEYVAADTMALLMEHGGDPNLAVDNEELFRHIDFDVWFDAVEQHMRWRFDPLVHIWMVLLAYGGEIGGQASSVQVFREYDSDSLFDLRKLRNHRDYYIGLSILNDQRTIHIYDKNTFWEVARR